MGKFYEICRGIKEKYHLTKISVATFAQVSHKHIVAFHDICLQEQYLITEWIPYHHHLHYQDIRRDTQLNICWDIFTLASQMLSAMQYVHEKADVIHFDVHPENIMVLSPAPDLSFKLTNFGMASSRNNLLAPAEKPFRHPYYTPPELRPAPTVQTNAGLADLCDVWMLGWTLVDMILSGDVEGTEQELSDKLVHFLGVADSNQPICHMINKMIEIEPTNRPKVHFIIDYMNTQIMMQPPAETIPAEPNFTTTEPDVDDLCFEGSDANNGTTEQRNNPAPNNTNGEQSNPPHNDNPQPNFPLPNKYQPQHQQNNPPPSNKSYHTPPPSPNYQKDHGHNKNGHGRGDTRGTGNGRGRGGGGGSRGRGNYDCNNETTTAEVMMEATIETTVEEAVAETVIEAATTETIVAAAAVIMEAMTEATAETISEAMTETITEVAINVAGVKAEEEDTEAEVSTYCIKRMPSELA
ncbi:kinase-like domain-containing protein [Podospora didyma]|uniref:Kinase-like domain-containing protein n=1 Tax=Podospora didyma TaxID=330526 RepID=A0AAE0K9J9_9PEZI|nr:kinase-like domain-containing protein [Podospora didyma]